MGCGGRNIADLFDHEMMMGARPATEPLYEYACHEGNYGMVNILRGERMEEQRASESGQ